MAIITHNKPSVGKEEIEEVSKVLANNWLIAGDSVLEFEECMKAYIGMKYAVALNSGHSALHLSLLALGVKEGDEVILPSFAPADLLNTVSYVKAIPVIADIEEEGFTISKEAVLKMVGKRSRAIIVPHLFGFPASLDELLPLGIPLIEDCAHAIGSYHKGKPLGSFGDVSAFSFYATKMMTTGQGGMVLTNDLKKAKLIRELIDYNSPKEYMVRYNYPMTDIAASMGVVQFVKLQSFIQRRREIAKKYREILNKKAYRFWPHSRLSEVNHFRFLLAFPSKSLREEVRRKLFAFGIETKSPIASYEVLHRLLGFSDKEYPNTSKMADALLSLPIYPSLTDEEVKKIVEILDSVLEPLRTLPLT